MKSKEFKVEPKAGQRFYLKDVAEPYDPVSHIIGIIDRWGNCLVLQNEQEYVDMDKSVIRNPIPKLYTKDVLELL